MTKDKPKEELTKAQKANENNRRVQMGENIIMNNWKKNFGTKQIRRGKDACRAQLINARKNPDPNETLKNLKGFMGLGKDTSASFTREAGYRW